MLTLRLTQNAVGENQYRVDVEVEGDGQPRQFTTVGFNFALASQEQENLRWYLEEYLQYPLEPAPKIARRVEDRMGETGIQLFQSIFYSSDDARDLWAVLRPQLNNLRIEIATNVAEAAAIPWELIRDPKTDTPLALRAQSFVRAHPQAAQIPELGETGAGPIRILLVICRPGGRDDVPFRSVATHLIKGLTEGAGTLFELDVLRPPTFEQLGQTLRAARQGGRPYQIVHFDGHGISVDVEKDKTLRSLLLSVPRKGSHGYLVFENRSLDENRQLVDGPAMGSLLVETRVPYLVLNACRSAHTDVRTEPEVVSADPHTKVRAFGSLAQEVMDAGVFGVVAMRYNVYVATAAQFVLNLYGSLVQGRSLGEAVTMGRKQLHDQPLRTIVFDPCPLQDWTVPVVYEAASAALFSKPQVSDMLTVALHPGMAMEREKLDPKLPPRPDVGFFGRDETLLALDRAFDRDRVVVLWAYAGSGKTTTAAEFVRWYALTGGLQGPALFTSFQQYVSLKQVLNDAFGRVFGRLLEQRKINWLALNDEDRLDVALRVLQQVPVLWVWDNVEPIGGFPSGVASRWRPEEQEQLKDFLRAASNGRARFLLTSRRDEEAWLGDLPTRVTLPPMPFLERVQLARALAEKRDRKLTDVEDWRRLLDFTRGNPLTVTVLVNQALRDGLKSKEDIEAFVARLRTGENAFEDEASEGRTKSLGASLSYGFENAFDEAARRQIAVLHLFQKVVDVDVLVNMGDSHNRYSLREFQGLTRETWVSVLDRAAEVGLLTALGDGRYAVHPALPWYFKNLFEHHYPVSSTTGSGPSPRDAVEYGFAQSIASLSDLYADVYGQNAQAVNALAFEEPNLLHVRELAILHGWWGVAISAMQGLFVLYDHKGRWAEFGQLVNELTPYFVDKRTEGPVEGREDPWNYIMGYRVRLSQESRNWEEADRLQRVTVEWQRRIIATTRVSDKGPLNNKDRKALRSLAVELNELGLTERERGNPKCVATFEEAISTCGQIDDKELEAKANLNLGVAYVTLESLYNLEKAEKYFRHSLDLTPESNKLWQSKCLSELGFVALARFNEAAAAATPNPDKLNSYMNEARNYYETALSLTPPDNLASLAVKHNALGYIYGIASLYSRAMDHYREAIRCLEGSGDLFNAGKSRLGVAKMLRVAGRPQDALDYAGAALDNLKKFGNTGILHACQELVTQLQREAQIKGG